jgi:uncharacterized protein RhaS with RHS repeats
MMRLLYDDAQLTDRRVRVTDAASSTVYHYDIMDRLRRIEQPDSTNIYFDYDPKGNMTRLRKPDWDEDKLIDHIFGFTPVNQFGLYQTPRTDDADYRYDYNRDRELSSVTYPSGKTVSLTHTNTRLELISTPEARKERDTLQ